MLLHVSFSLMFCVSASLTRPYNQRQAESSLIQMLLADYDPDVRPVLNHTSSVSVHLMFTPVRIDDLDLRGEDLKLTGWLGMTWTDEMFQWQPRNESGVRYLLLSHKDFWVPPITVLNSLKGLFASHDQTHSSKVSVRWDGTSHYAISDNFAISCDVNIHYFPFDHQTCDVTFLSWYHPMTQMVLTSEAKDIDMRHYEEDGEWRLLSTGVTVSPHNISLHPFHADDVTFSRVCFTFSVLRRPRYYMINVLLPCLLLCVLVLINFFLPPDSGEKVSLGITVLLAFTVFQLLIAEVIPTSASETPLLAVYLICIMAMSTLSVIMSVCVLNLHHRTVYSHPPPWLRHLVLHYLARAMYMQISHVTGKIQPVREWREKEQSSTPNLTTSVSPARRNSANDTKITLTVDEQADKPHSFANPMTSDNVMDCNSDSDSRHIHLRHVLKGRGGSEHRLGGRHGILSREDIAGALKRTAMSERDVTNRSATTTTTLQPDVPPSYMLPVDSKSAARLMQSINNLSLAGGERDRSRSQLEFIRAVRDVYHELQTTRQAGELEHALVNEWKLIARVVDRLFFWITFLTLMVTTVAVFSVRE